MPIARKLFLYSAIIILCGVINPDFAQAQASINNLICGRSYCDSSDVLWSADRGNPHGQFELGRMYQYGRGITKIHSKAVYWYRKAADQNHAEAQANLAYMYESGKGVGRDTEEAIRWYRKAAENGDLNAQRKLAKLSKENTQDQNVNTVQKKVAISEPKPLAKPKIQNQTSPRIGQKDIIAANQNKVALVIGNSDYSNATPLPNPKNDAADMVNMLDQMGFTVVSGIDLDKAELEQTIRRFVKKARQADVSLFFYAGHAIQVAGQNYMVPIDAAVTEPSALDFELVNMSVVSNYMGGLDSVGIILLDACRDNPFSRSLKRSMGATRSAQVGTGLASVASQGGGLLIGFATAPNDVAADGEGDNSPFTSALLKHLPTPGLEIELAMKRVKAEVIGLTKNDQRPWHNSDLAKEVYLVAEQ